MKKIHITFFILLVIGGLNWLLVGLFEFDLVASLFDDSLAAKLIYIFVGIAALFELFTHKLTCKVCTTTHKEESAAKKADTDQESVA